MELALVENLQRERTSNRFEEAKAIMLRMRITVFTQEMAPSGSEKSPSSITNALRLLSLPDKVLSMLETELFLQDTPAQPALS
jgi:ParB family chromosome partitioning protein